MERRFFLRSLAVLPFFAATPLFSKPRQAKQILLLETSLAGFQYYSGEELWNRLKIGQDLRLERERNNPYDKNAVAVHVKVWKLGYVPMADNTIIARMMDSGVNIDAKITRLTKCSDPWERVRINLVMTA